MNVFKNLLFLHGYLIDPHEADDPDGDSFAQGYGNQVASDKAFAPLGHAHAAVNVARITPCVGQDLCPTGACG